MNVNLLQSLQQLAGGNDLLGHAAASADLIKALEASQGVSDVATLTGGSSLTRQSLDNVMKATIQTATHMTLMNKLPKTNATSATLDEYIRQTSVGGFLGGSATAAMDVIRPDTGEYKRITNYPRHLMSLRQVSGMLELSNNVSDAVNLEEKSGALKLMSDAEFLMYSGHSDSCPVQFNSIFREIDLAIAAGEMDGSNVIDMDGASLSTIEPLAKIAAAVTSYSNWGQLTDIILPPSVQTDLNQGIDPAYRWSPDGTNMPMLGGHVSAIRLNQFLVKTATSTFMPDVNHNPGLLPYEARSASAQAAAVANSAVKPVSITGVAAANGSSKFTAARAGNYYYAVAGIKADGDGWSQVTKSAQIAVASGDAVTLTITASAGSAESGYAIFRGRQDGTNATDDLRLMTVVAKSGATTTYVDLNKEIPGTVKVPVLNIDPGSDAIDWRSFMPMTKIPLPAGVGGRFVQSWFQIMSGYLRVSKPRHHGYVKNVLPTTATWKPFTVA